MANLGGGGAEAHARFKQYEYRANSSLVLTTDSRPRDTHEPTGEPETLWGKIDPRSFGDRAVQTKPPELQEKLAKAKGKKKRASAADPTDLPSKRRRRAAPSHHDVSVLSLTDDVVYKPQTKETRAAYEALLSIIQQQLGGQPLDVLGGAADEVLAILKNDKVKNPDKKKDIEKLLNTVSNQTFDQLVSIGKLITDFHDASGDSAAAAPSGADGMDTTLDDDIGVAVEFEESVEEEDSDLDQVQDDIDEDEEDDAAEFNGPGGMQMGGELDDDDLENANQALNVNVQDIDAYWLQRKITQAYGEMDPQRNQKLAEEILKIIAEGDDRDVENRLVMLLDYEKFDLIKLLLRNRLKIVWCTGLARAEDQEQRKNIEDEMVADPSLASILEHLHREVPWWQSRILSAVASNVIGRLISFLIGKYQERSAADARLHRALRRARVIVEESEGRQIANRAMLQQLNQLRCELFRAAYALDSFRLRNWRSQAAVRRSLPHTGPSPTSDCSASLSAMVERMEAALSDMREFVVLLGACPRVTRQPYSTYLFMESCMFGRQLEKEHIISFLLQPSHHQDLDVLPIIGPHEIGRRTLVEHVCLDERVRERFAKVHRLRSDKLDDELPNHDHDWNVFDFTARSLTVIDMIDGDTDVEEAWRRFHSAVRRRARRGSKIIVISRTEEHASLGTVPPLRLHPPRREEFWYFFRALAFGAADPDERPDLARIARAISADMTKVMLFAGTNFIAASLREDLSARSWRQWSRCSTRRMCCRSMPPATGSMAIRPV